MSNPVNKFLDESDRIEELSDEAVKDIFIRAEVWRRSKDRYIHRLESDACKEFLKGLRCTSGGKSLYSVLRDALDTSTYMDMMSSDESPEDFLWDRWTDSSLDEGEKIGLARRNLNKTVNGSTGMPVMDVVRDGIKGWE